MQASDICRPMPTVTLQDPVARALKVMAAERLPGLAIVDDKQRPLVVLPGTQVLRMSLAHGYQEDPALARAIDEEHADQFWLEEVDRPVRECMPPKTGKAKKSGIVSEDATLLEVAGVMSRLHTPVVAVVDRDGRLIGGITLTMLLDHLHLPELPG